MRWKNSTTRYGLVARTLHWTSVALLVFLFIDISGIDAAPKLASRADYVERHLVVGTLLLAVMLLRLWWRLRNPNPVFAYEIGATHRRLALTVHRTLYVFVIVLGVTGLGAWFVRGAELSLLVHARLAPLLLALVVVHACAGVLNQVFVPSEPRVSPDGDPRR